MAQQQLRGICSSLPPSVPSISPISGLSSAKPTPQNTPGVGKTPQNTPALKSQPAPAHMPPLLSQIVTEAAFQQSTETGAGVDDAVQQDVQNATPTPESGLQNTPVLSQATSEGGMLSWPHGEGAEETGDDDDVQGDVMDRFPTPEGLPQSTPVQGPAITKGRPLSPEQTAAVDESEVNYPVQQDAGNRSPTPEGVPEYIPRGPAKTPFLERKIRALQVRHAS